MCINPMVPGKHAGCVTYPMIPGKHAGWCISPYMYREACWVVYTSLYASLCTLGGIHPSICLPTLPTLGIPTTILHMV